MTKELNELAILLFSHQFVELNEEQQRAVIEEYRKRRKIDYSMTTAFYDGEITI